MIDSGGPGQLSQPLRSLICLKENTYVTHSTELLKRFSIIKYISKSGFMPWKCDDDDDDDGMEDHVPGIILTTLHVCTHSFNWHKIPL